MKSVILTSLLLGLVLLAGCTQPNPAGVQTPGTLLTQFQEFKAGTEFTTGYLEVCKKGSDVKYYMLMSFAPSIKELYFDAQGVSLGELLIEDPLQGPNPTPPVNLKDYQCTELDSYAN